MSAQPISGLLAALLLTLDEQGPLHFKDLREAGRKAGEKRRVAENRVSSGLYVLKARGLVLHDGAWWFATEAGYEAAVNWRRAKAASPESPSVSQQDATS